MIFFLLQIPRKLSPTVKSTTHETPCVCQAIKCHIVQHCAHQAARLHTASTLKAIYSNFVRLPSILMQLLRTVKAFNSFFKWTGHEQNVSLCHTRFRQSNAPSACLLITEIKPISAPLWLSY